MKIDILTLFPEMFKGPFDESIIKRAKEKGFVDIKVHDLRKWSVDERGTVDDRPYGGGPGMVFRVDVVDKAIEELKSKNTKIVLLDARGKKFTQSMANSFSKCSHLILIAGHYEGVDARIAEHLVDEVVSIGDYVLTGGELPAMVITDAVVRLVPDVIKPESLATESHSLKIVNSKIENYLEYPQYTRPEEYKGWKVPKVLLSGNHKEISEWRNKKS